MKKTSLSSTPKSKRQQERLTLDSALNRVHLFETYPIESTFEPNCEHRKKKRMRRLQRYVTRH